MADDERKNGKGGGREGGGRRDDRRGGGREGGGRHGGDRERGASRDGRQGAGGGRGPGEGRDRGRDDRRGGPGGGGGEGRGGGGDRERGGGRGDGGGRRDGRSGSGGGRGRGGGGGGREREDRRGGSGGGGREGRGGGRGWEERRDGERPSGGRDRRDGGGAGPPGRDRDREPRRGGDDRRRADRREWDGGKNRGARRERDARKDRRDRDDRWNREDRGGREGRDRRGGRDWRRDRDDSDEEGDGGGRKGGRDGDGGTDRPSAGTPDKPSAGVRLIAVEEVEVEVEKLVAGGDGLARFEGIPLFVPRSAPGDRLRVRITQRRPDYGRAEIVEILQPGPGRREPPCFYFERCGGCDLQHLEDDLQTRLKAEAVVETLARLGNLPLDEPPEIRTAGHWGYRLRTQLHSAEAEEAEVDGAEGDGGPRLAVGYFQRGSRDLVPVAACPILVPSLESLLPGLPRLLEAEDRPPRRLDLAAGGRAGEGGERRGGAGAADRRGEPVPITAAPVVEGLPQGEITLEVPDLAGGGEDGEGGGTGPFTYVYDARCFFQSHRDLVPRLVADAVGDWRGETAYDLYAGVGLFALPLARRYRRVVAVEGDGIAARYARRNARGHGLDHLEVEHQALETWIPQLPEAVDRVIVDPPRGGLARRVRRELLEKRPVRLTYVSCHAATLARDLRHLTAAYRLESVVLLDMFPQSGHMEAVAQLVLDPEKAPPPRDDGE